MSNKAPYKMAKNCIKQSIKHYKTVNKLCYKLFSFSAPLTRSHRKPPVRNTSDHHATPSFLAQSAGLEAKQARFACAGVSAVYSQGLYYRTSGDIPYMMIVKGYMMAYNW